MSDRDCSTCVFCDCDRLEPQFALPILGRSAQWMRCGRCRSIQVSRVDWLDEAYRDLGVNIDTGCAQRSILCSLYVRAMRAAGLLGRRGKVIDFGAGNGLLVRLLRDQGFEALGYDRYVRAIDCAGFTVETLDAGTHHEAELVTAIDVLEHLPYPRRTLADIAANLAPQGLVLLRTPLCQPKVHGVDWEHLGGEHGQHISFATREGLQHLAESAGLRANFLPMDFLLLTRPDQRAGALRRLRLTLRAGWYFFLARSMGLCRFENALRDIQLLMANREPKR